MGRPERAPETGAEPGQGLKVAIACQGGGSHTAFTAGVLRRILASDNHEIVALSGTSGGAICGLLAWYGLLQDDRDLAADLLKSFWERNSASTPLDWLWNRSLVMAGRFVPGVEISPYHVFNVGQEALKRLLEEHVPFATLKDLVTEDSPELLVAAVDVLEGTFRVFRKHEITVESMLATTAVPPLFRSVEIKIGEAPHYFWDGLLSQNPPLRDLPDVFGKRHDRNPDEIWVIQINPDRRDKPPIGISDIEDRRNELAGNLSLRQEMEFIGKINELVAARRLVNSPYKITPVHRIELGKPDLDYPSKLDRSPDFIEWLMELGEEAAEDFLAAHKAGVIAIAR
ncbi:MAG: patatin-like phospholipase family protein [Rhodospirillales bacterium]|nr:patatin-like phospholipase family protein [Rhodospirillales bacterium]